MVFHDRIFARIFSRNIFSGRLISGQFHGDLGLASLCSRSGPVPCRPGRDRFLGQGPRGCHGGVANNGWFISWKSLLKWMITGGIPISGNLQIY